MVRQEIYALLCVYQAIRHLIATAAESAAIDPDRISFTRTVEAVRRHVSDEAALSPSALADLVDDVIYEITDPRHLLPETRRTHSFHREQRRSGRRFPKQRDRAKKPLPPRTKITLWLLDQRQPAEPDTPPDAAVHALPTPDNNVQELDNAA
ncbi:hypothetical protein E1292_16955 [Nonomuraea deserti]|uniref:Uncharacterized protein n=2 Tax=Nonomuraea deserti TaxID=1848322 RepID=A0A4R4VKM0_9ACTN|nr:hypothetical protein E1292_16955 [Nonomuraea deserti]